MDVEIDEVLLRRLRRAGMTERTIAVHAAGVLAGDARSVRAIGTHADGEPDFRDDVVMAPVDIARGVCWCGGSLRIDPDSISLSHSVLEAANGLPLSVVVDHPDLPHATVTGNRVGDDDRFAITQSNLITTATRPGRRDERATVIDTDAAPTTMRLCRTDTMLAPFMRIRDDAPHTRGLRDRKERATTVLNAVVILLAVAIGMVYAGWSAAVATATAVAVDAVWFCAALHWNGEQRSTSRMPHFEFRKTLRDRNT